MHYERLDQMLRSRTPDGMGLGSAVAGYADEVRRTAAVTEVRLDSARCDPDQVRIEIVLTDAPGILVSWVPAVGWSFTDREQGTVRYRVGSEADAASIVPEAEVVAAWLAVLADGGRDGHLNSPEPLDTLDEALVERMRTFGAGRNPGTPY